MGRDRKGPSADASQGLQRVPGTEKYRGGEGVTWGQRTSGAYSVRLRSCGGSDGVRPSQEAAPSLDDRARPLVGVGASDSEHARPALPPQPVGAQSRVGAPWPRGRVSFLQYGVGHAESSHAQGSRPRSPTHRGREWEDGGVAVMGARMSLGCAPDACPADTCRGLFSAMWLKRRGIW